MKPHSLITEENRKWPDGFHYVIGMDVVEGKEILYSMLFLCYGNTSLIPMI